MKSQLIRRTTRYLLVSYGNGTAYLLVKKARPSLPWDTNSCHFQGDDARELDREIAAGEEAGWDDERILRELYTKYATEK
jgi:hypothetical protein